MTAKTVKRPEIKCERDSSEALTDMDGYEVQTLLYDQIHAKLKDTSFPISLMPYISKLALS